MPGHRVTALALDGTSPLDLGAVTEVFGIDRGLAPRWYGTIFVRYPGRTEVARPEDIRALLERHVTPFREAYDLARETVEIARARQAAEERERRKHALLDILSLVNEIFSKAYQVNNPGRWRCKEQLDLSSHLIDMDTDLQHCRMLAGAGQGNEAVAWAVQARHEVEAELRKLAAGT